MLSKLIDALAGYANVVAVISLVAMTLLINVEVFSRTLFNVSTLISEEWSSYMLVYVMFLGLAVTFRQNAFLRVEIIFLRLRKRHQDVVRLIYLLLAVIFVILFDYQLVAFVLSSYLGGLKSISFSETPLYIPQIAMPIGLTLLGLQLLRDGIQSVIDLRRSTTPGT
jgi:TRAP-type C4-dicarboxylate transport system permease small subunit